MKGATDHCNSLVHLLIHSLSTLEDSKDVHFRGQGCGECGEDVEKIRLWKPLAPLPVSNGRCTRGASREHPECA